MMFIFKKALLAMVVISGCQVGEGNEKIIHPELRKVQSAIEYGTWSDWKAYQSAPGIEYRERLVRVKMSITDYEAEYRDKSYTDYRKAFEVFVEKTWANQGKANPDAAYLKSIYPKEPPPLKVKKVTAEKVIELPKQYEYREVKEP